MSIGFYFQNFDRWLIIDSKIMENDQGKYGCDAEKRNIWIFEKNNNDAAAAVFFF